MLQGKTKFLGWGIAVAAVCAAGAMSNAAHATVAVQTVPVAMTIKPTQNIDNAFAILGTAVSSSSGTYFNGDFAYLGNLTSGGTYTVHSPAIADNGNIYGTIIGLAPAQSGSSTQNVILGLGSSSASDAINNNVALSSYINYLAALIPSSFSYTNSTGTTFTISGISINATDPKTSVDEILNGTYPANLAISSGGSTFYNQTTDVIPYTVTLPFIGTISPITVGTNFNFSLPITSDVATALGQNAISLNSGGELVNFDSPTNVGSITVAAPEPTAAAMLGLMAVGSLALLRRRRS
ncbi:MAG: PEP-CTERM sorting domain-containing protein [Phycisphaerae bacterium]